MKKLLIIGAIIAVITLFIFFRYDNLKVQNSPLTPEKTENALTNVQGETSANNDYDNCGAGELRFDHAPVNLEKTEVFLPLGLMTGSHVTPIDHHYFQNFFNNKPDIEVYSPGEGYVTSIQLMPVHAEVGDYRVVIEHNCGVSSIYIHIFSLSEKLYEAIKDKEYASVKIRVEAGELIGYYKNNVDYNLVDESITLEGFITPEIYQAEPWKIHVPDTYKYFNEPIKSQLIAKSIRTAEPISGKIDYDMAGKLVGNWFLENTNGYAGVSAANQGGKYWLGHLTIAYDAYDSERIVFSIGGYEGKDSEQFAVKGNSPDPADIGIETGVVKYELVVYDWLTPGGNSWDRKSLEKPLKTVAHENSIQGVALVQVLEGNKIMFETFPSKTATQVEGFTNNAKIYER